MPIKIRIKPEHTFTAGDALIKNVGTKAADLMVMNDVPVRRDDYREKEKNVG